MGDTRIIVQNNLWPGVGLVLVLIVFVLLGVSFIYQKVHDYFYSCYGSQHFSVKQVSTTIEPSDKSITFDLAELVNTGNDTSNNLMVEVSAFDVPQNTNGTKLGHRDLNTTIPAGRYYPHLIGKVKVEQFPAFEQPEVIRVCVLEQCYRDKTYVPVICRDTSPPYTFREKDWRVTWSQWLNHLLDKLRSP